MKSFWIITVIATTTTAAAFSLSTPPKASRLTAGPGGLQGCFKMVVEELQSLYPIEISHR